ncbi:hypothetical protein A8924_0783 [Saccharopolyspora erythraea NRRL 2338]|uniref:Uncharacterized protein n=2 Tax=Saccharopolyspora erythraea TaxID=1836 RepID=A4F6R1_SACEN|nr:hypothetical protein [Saccharopolyspora erythraea]EQD87310.1 hypothetical protein N599_05275 [Saccharopolyspora erythraea D]PFG93538.1 hypothetical protein A8924_0783 [Saccharopolyspora erythraea NRRL 2338]QRK90392.1 hypothetical protein JQX30_02415 [Saccharopolyspora erythraea]CAL99735.1 hypothetical protein SACE_0387 [Saccharopolyspora erythraea NRRL 2338]
MKRSLSAAAAVLAGGAGVAGLAGAATAAEMPEFGIDMPVQGKDTVLATSNFTGALQSAHKMVGDVVPASPTASRSDTPHPLGPAGELNSTDPVGGVLNPLVGQVATPKTASPFDIVGGVLPHGQQLPVNMPAGRTSPNPVNGVIDPLMGEGGGSPLGGPVGGAVDALGTSNGSTPVVGDALNQSTPVQHPMGRSTAGPLVAVAHTLADATGQSPDATGVHKAAGNVLANGPLSGNIGA